MNPKEADWSQIFTRALLQQVGRTPQREDLERVVAELRAAREDPEGAGIGRQLRAMGLGSLAGPEGALFVRQIIDVTLAQLTALMDSPAETPPVADGADALALLVAQARALLSPFQRPGAPLPQLTAALRPRDGDYAVAFQPAYAAVARQAYGRLWDGEPPVIGPKPGQTELLISAAPAERILAEGPPPAFPGGFSRVTHLLLPGPTWLCWKFVRPGQAIGMAFDGLCWCGDHFAWFPRTWRVLGHIEA
ncbi:MAG: hypothetical protein ABIO70_15355 [Pseudomonadota bacterium]